MGSDLINVVAAVIQRGDKYLICLRPEYKRHGGLWEFPGGKLDHAETPSEGIARELREELGVTTTTVGPLLYSTQDPASPFIIQFYPVGIRGEPAALEHREIAWVSPNEMQALPLAPSDRAFAGTLLGDHP
jgi:mutator protein MutT